MFPSLKFVVMAARPGFWLTSIWFYLLPCGGTWVFDRPLFWLGLIYVTLPLGLLIYGFNDVVDYETDRLNPRKGTFLFGARGERSELQRLPLAILLVQMPFWAAFLLTGGLKFLPWIGLLLLLTALYNWPGWGFKNRPALDMLNQAGYLLVFVLASWLTGLPQLPWVSLIFGWFFAMHSHLLGQIMDLEPDRRAGRRSTAVVIGIARSKWLLAGLLLTESALLLLGLRQNLAAFVLAAGAIYFAVDALRGEKLYDATMMRLFLLGWNAVALLTIPYVWLTRMFV